MVYLKTSKITRKVSLRQRLGLMERGQLFVRIPNFTDEVSLENHGTNISLASRTEFPIHPWQVPILQTTEHERYLVIGNFDSFKAALIINKFKDFIGLWNKGVIIERDFYGKLTDEFYSLFAFGEVRMVISDNEIVNCASFAGALEELKTRPLFDLSAELKSDNMLAQKFRVLKKLGDQPLFRYRDEQGQKTLRGVEIHEIFDDYFIGKSEGKYRSFLFSRMDQIRTVQEKLNPSELHEITVNFIANKITGKPMCRIEIFKVDELPRIDYENYVRHAREYVE